jgi:hypothetical protein
MSNKKLLIEQIAKEIGSNWTKAARLWMLPNDDLSILLAGIRDAKQKVRDAADT